jgi:hypothetical protein
MSSSAVKDDEKKPDDEPEPHPADDDPSTGGERTVATAFSGIELDPNMPLPISVPPPAMNAAKDPPKTAGTQRMAPAPGAPKPPVPKPPSSAAMPAAKPVVPKPPPPRPAGVPRDLGRPSAPKIPLPPPPSQRTPRAPTPSNPGVTDTSPLPKLADAAEDDDPTNDGPTMATAPGAMTGLLAKSAAPGFSPPPPAAGRPPPSMSDADTVSRVDQLVPEQEETTRAVSREELFRSQDAHVIVGDDAIGDEATLAVAPGDNDSLGIGAALKQTLESKKDEPPAFPPPPGQFAPPPISNQQPFSPLQPNIGPPPMQQQQPPPSWQGNAHPISAPYPMQQQQPMSGQYPMGGMMPMNAQTQHAPMQQPPMWQQPQGAQGPGFKITPQIIALVAVGAVCLAIFIVGLYLFFTTKF